MHELTSSPLTGVVLGAAALVWICARQLIPRPVKEDSKYVGVFVLAVIGLVQVTEVMDRVQPVEVAATVLGLVSGACFGALRASRVHLWQENGQLMRRGNALTVTLWLVGIGVHVGIEALGGALAGAAQAGSRYGTATLLIYLAASLGTQKLVLQRRVRGHADVGQSTVS